MIRFLIIGIIFIGFVILMFVRYSNRSIKEYRAIKKADRTEKIRNFMKSYPKPPPKHKPSSDSEDLDKLNDLIS